MAKLQDLIPYLRCPVTKQGLEIKKDELYSKEADMSFFNFDEIPWLFKEPLPALFEWQKKIRDVIQYYEQLGQSIEAPLRQAELLTKTKDRLNQLQEAYLETSGNLKILTESILDFEGRNAKIDEAIHEKVPRNQTVGAYYENIFRDWVWGENENKQSLNFILELLDGHKDLGAMATLGAGACRLPYDLHRTLNPKLTVAVDTNPLLLLTAKHLHDGGEIELFEFPRVPVNLESSAVKHNLKLQGKSSSNFHFLFADGLNLPFKASSFNTIFTPWFIDIIPQDLRSLAGNLNAALAKEGLWVNFGQLGFDRADLSQNYTPEEVKDILKEQGFEVLNWLEKRLPYLQSPHSAFGRQDLVFGFVARKIKAGKQAKEFHHYPEWLSHYDSPIAMDSTFMQLGLKAQVYGDILSKVNGVATINDLVSYVEKQYQMDSMQARELIVNLFINIYEGYIFKDL